MNGDSRFLERANSIRSRPGRAARRRFTPARRKALAAPVVSWVCVAPATALAYIGPGAGLSALGSLIALIGAVLFILVGFVWYPIKRAMRTRKAARAAQEHAKAESPASK